MVDPVVPKRVDASPTKNFFISMLTKDIDLIDAILDLVDNSIDGARRLRRDSDYSGITIRIQVDRDHFRIADNAGGIPVKLAEKYVFRFGRPEEMEPTPHSVGQFGVGMKRALFKMGKAFKVDSTTADSHFAVNVDVDEWKNRPDDWNFEFAQLSEGLDNIPQDDQGTIIEITNLHGSVSDDFATDAFQTRLAKALSQAHIDGVGKGVHITLNGIPLQVRDLVLKQSDELNPAYKEITYQEKEGDAIVQVKIYAGIADSDPSASGWYVFCNGRLILGAEQTNLTGWGEDNGRTLPKHHNQFARFRGFVFFDSDDSGLLPWNTTKTGVDADSAIFRSVRQEIIRMTRPVIDFLNRLDAEKDSKDDEIVATSPLETAVQSAKQLTLSNLNTTYSTFVAPKPNSPVKRVSEGRITYSRPLDKIRRVQQLLQISTNKDVGEMTFDYFLKMEGDE